ncbi:hypothetical protein K7B10_07835 [Streptomyces flavotricini]|uniref:Uncharacterized protein n=1 Tax=Streptomyces flavotricini TaxID=66888 RepID=A0ABS8E186_9ACTN|nr:hypothetical protein [Streptomyces flavotricini]MCC0094695.1 hypothetical protein [Streptomyces flavotricini]
MTKDPATISITRGRGGQVEAEGPIDALAWALLDRAGFIRQPTLSGTWHRLPFDMGEAWENEHASYAAEMLRAARYAIRLDPALTPGGRPAPNSPRQGAGPIPAPAAPAAVPRTR